VKVDGIWKIEILGHFGWEAVSTAFLEKGRYLAASQDHYTIGQYEVSGDNIRVEAAMHRHSEAQRSPGSSKARLVFAFEGRITDGHISGQLDDNAGQQSITARGTRLGDIA
jgi:hypothetical protein